MALGVTRIAFGVTRSRPRARLATLAILPAFLLAASSATLAQSSTTTVSAGASFGFIGGTATVTIDTGPNDCEPENNNAVLLLQFPGGTCQTSFDFTVSCQNEDNFVAPGVQQVTGSYTGYSGTDNNGDNCAVPGSTAYTNVTVPQGATTTSVQAPSGPIQSGQTVSLPITVVGPQYNSYAPGPTGLATLYYDGQALASQQVQTTGGVATSTATLTASTKGVPPGQYQAVVKYSGDAVYLPSTSSPVTVTIEASQLSTTTALSVSPNPLVAGETTTLNITVTPSGNVPPTGTVTILANGAKVDTATLTNGAATIAAPTTGLPPGTYSVLAVYSGDSFNLPSTSTAVSVKLVSTTPTTINIAVSPAIVTQGQSTQITATVRQQIGNVVPTGTVTLAANSTQIATIALKDGVATLNASTADPSINSPGVGVLILAPSTLTLTASPNPVTQGNISTLTATVLDGNGNPVTSGTVNFSYSGNALGSASLGTGGTAQLPIATTTFTPGTYLITANYLGSYKSIPPSSGTVNLVVTSH